MTAIIVGRLLWMKTPNFSNMFFMAVPPYRLRLLFLFLNNLYF
jgi:hypothetical protein